MNLLIDSGNSYTKAALCDHKEIVAIKKLNSLAELKAFINRQPIRKAIISSVNKDIEEIQTYLEGIELIKFSHETNIPISNAYKTPQTLGLDRLAVAIGANNLYPNDHCLCIDAGTCVTYDLVNDKGMYLGGSISPGLNMRYNALHTFTAKLPLVERTTNFSLIGTNTHESIVNGVQMGIILEMKGIIDQYRMNFSKLRVIITGGDAIFFESNVKDSIFVEPKLLFIGLKRILEYNVSTL